METNQVALDDMKAQEEFILLWKQKKEVDRLEKLSGQHTSLISLLLPPDTQIPKVTKMLTQELGTASCIKSRVNRQSVIDGLKSIQHRMVIVL